MASVFEPPALLNDFDAIPGQREGWHRYMSATFNREIAALRQALGGGEPQFFNSAELTPDGIVSKDIAWLAIPRTFVRRFGRQRAFEILDEPHPDPKINNVRSRLQDEYCEWRPEHDPDTGKILRIVFTCEGPEYWQSIAGGPSFYDRAGEAPADFGATGDRNVLLQLYRDVLGHQQVQIEDLFFPDQPDTYNPWNRWNTDDGIVHLQQINNTLGAEINIGAQATISRTKRGTPVTDATRLICCAGYGGAERSSDPSLGHEVNQLARRGCLLSLKSPVGIYMEGLDDSGFTKPGPDGTRVPAGHYWRPLRPAPDQATGFVVRAVYEVPAGELGPDGEQLTVSDIQIGGTPIRHGAQLAERITMKFIALASRPELVEPRPQECRTKCCRKNGVLAVSGLNDTCEDVFPSTAADTLLANLPAITRGRGEA